MRESSRWIQSKAGAKSDTTGVGPSLVRQTTGLGQLVSLPLIPLSLVTLPALGFPPALPHQLYGVVRDQIGNPLDSGATVIFKGASGVKLSAGVCSQPEPSVNYRLERWRLCSA
jgi:hypothetical protein